MILDIISLVILLFLIALLFVAIILLGPLPGKIAKNRNHSQKDAILVCGWIGIFTGGLLWIVAIIWAYINPVSTRVSDLEERLKIIEEKTRVRSIDNK